MTRSMLHSVYDKDPGAEEPDEGKALMSGSVVAVRGATPSPTITQSDAAPRSGIGAKLGNVTYFELKRTSGKSRRG